MSGGLAVVAAGIRDLGNHQFPTFLTVSAVNTLAQVSETLQISLSCERRPGKGFSQFSLFFGGNLGACGNPIPLFV